MEPNLALCDNLDGPNVGWWGGSERRGDYTHTHAHTHTHTRTVMTDLHCCTAETNTIL